MANVLEGDRRLILDRAVQASLGAIREYGRSEVLSHMQDLFDGMERIYLMELTTATPDGLAATQAKWRQVVALRDALFAEQDGLHSPLI